MIHGAAPALQDHLLPALVSTAEGRRIDVLLALTEDGVPVQRHRRILAAYEAWVADHSQPFPAALPDEFRRYRLAIDAMLGEDLAGARAQLSALARPSSRYRGTWAAYMLGNLESSDAQRIAAYQQVRALAAGGALDTLGLALASLRQESTLHLAEAPERYLSTCMTYLQHGGKRSCSALEDHARAILSGPAEDLDRVVADPVANVALTASLLSTLEPLHQSSGRLWTINHSRLKIQALDQVDPEDGSWQARWRRWQQAMERVEGDMPGTASVLGWAMYEAGLYAEAGEVVAGADAADPLVAWLQAHLLLRDGDRASAITLLQRAAATSDDPAYAVTLGHQLVRADRYEEALAAFLQAAAWPDVAWVAEQILSVAELETVVASWPLDFGVPPAEDADLSAASHAPRSWLLDYRRAQDVGNELVSHWPAEVLQAELLRALLARRLARAGRWEDAAEVAPQPERERLEVLVALQEQAAAAAGAARGRLLWAQARQIRAEGSALLATELEPDFAIYRMNFSRGPFIAHRLQQDISADERQRLTDQVLPQRRYHYRYVAAELAWDAAALLPDQDEETLQVLCQAGHWLEKSDPTTADPFYKAMVNRGHQTALGQEADQRRWFPPLVDGRCVVPPPPATCAAAASPAALWGLAAVALGWRRRRWSR